jgi:drug/metabolite transporter (DMT)-like permease
MNLKRWNILTIVIFLLWGTMHPLLKILSDALPPLLINFLRFAIALLLLTPFVLNQKRIPTQRDLIKIGLLGMIGIALYGFLSVTGLHRSTAINSSILLNSHPVIAAIVTPFLFGEKLHSRGVFGIILGFIGVILVVTDGFNLSAVLDTRYVFGNLLLFLSAVCLAVYAMSSKFFVPHYGSLVTTFYAVLAGTSVLLAGIIVTGDITQIKHLSLKQIFFISYIALVVTAIAWVVWFKAIERIGVIRTETLFFLTPIAGVASSAVFLGERITGITIIGTGCILAGVFLVQRRERGRVGD